jgi:hypothetical protein
MAQVFVGFVVSDHFIADGHTFVADVDCRPRDQAFDFILLFPRERAAKLGGLPEIKMLLFEYVHVTPGWETWPVSCESPPTT